MSSTETDRWPYCPNCGGELNEPAGPDNEWTTCPTCGTVRIDFIRHQNTAADDPHEKIDPNSREMELLESLSREWTSLGSIRTDVDYGSVDTYVRALLEMGFVDRRKTRGEKVKYRISVLGMGVREHYRSHDSNPDTRREPMENSKS